eukprot:2471006-Amphidinium_carterae.3
MQGACNWMHFDHTLGLWGFLSSAWAYQQGPSPCRPSRKSPEQLSPQGLHDYSVKCPFHCGFAIGKASSSTSFFSLLRCSMRLAMDALATGTRGTAVLRSLRTSPGKTWPALFGT